MNWRFPQLALVPILLLAWIGWIGCTERVPEATCSCAEGTIVDAPLMAFLSKARSAHHQADLEQQAQNPKAAIHALEKLTSEPPNGILAMPEAREVLADTRARLADLKGKLGNHDEAERDIQAGLMLAPKDSYFEGHLHEMRGVNEERRANQLTQEGRDDDAESARRRAFESFEAAIHVQDRVIRRELGDAEGEAP